MKDKPKLAKIALRLSLAIAFGYAAIGGFLQPEIWLGYMPPFIATSPYAETVLMLFSGFEVVLTLWLLSGIWIKYAAIVAALMLVGIVGANITDMTIVFRDLALIFAAIALALLS